eukprot:5797499-Pyramimonas_sp.AAC.1
MTSARIISPLGKRPCAFGCMGKRDALKHYARCPVLWSALRRALARPFALDFPSRWGLRRPSCHSYSVLAAAYN